ncbi:TIGR02594 family protein [Rhodopseudomonas sp. NSM]|uniref:TIGR02594 family protein n=1 Tax=Rhodopseudomonas sp. NSM TaxID=3457630 RepID=UPI0040354A1D
MVEFTAFRFSRVIVWILGFAAIAALTSPASARPLHRHHGHHTTHYSNWYQGDQFASQRGYQHRAGKHHGKRYGKRHGRGYAKRHARSRPAQAAANGFAQPQQFGFAGFDQAQTGQAQAFAPNYAAATSAPRMMKQRAQRRSARVAPTAQQAQWQTWNGGGGGGSSLVAEARRYIGGNPTGRSRLWCARFMNMVLERSGHRGTGSDMASSFARYGQRISGPQVGAIAVMSRGKRGGHVGIVSGIDSSGNPIVVSGNHGRRVAESVYSKSRIYAYVMPSS